MQGNGKLSGNSSTDVTSCEENLFFYEGGCQMPSMPFLFP